EDRAGDREVGAPRLEPGYPQPLVEVQRGELLADVANLFGRDAPIPQRRARRASFCRGGDRAETEDRSRRPDDAVEAGAVDLLQVLADLGMDVARELPFVARLERVRFHEPLGETDHAKLEAAPEVDRRPRAARHFDAAAADVDDHRDVARN